jgi:hypothetical protein
LLKQYGFDAISLMPTNLYGQGDNYHPTHSHVMAAMIRRFKEAREAGAEEVVCWGSGSPLREFLLGDDLASAAIIALEHWQPMRRNVPGLAHAAACAAVLSKVIGTRALSSRSRSTTRAVTGTAMVESCAGSVNGVSTRTGSGLEPARLQLASTSKPKIGTTPRHRATVKRILVPSPGMSRLCHAKPRLR